MLRFIEKFENSYGNLTYTFQTTPQMNVSFSMKLYNWSAKERESLHLSKIQGTIYSDDLGPKWNGA